MDTSTPTQPAADKPADGRWSQRRPAAAAAAYAVGYLAASLAGGWLVGRTTSPVAAGLTVTAVATVALALSLLLVLSVCRVPMRPRQEVAGVLVMSAVFAAIRPAVFAFLGRWLGFPAAGERIAQALAFVPGQALLGNAALIVWAALLGRLVSRVIREGKLLLPVAAVASIADIITVFWGVVKHVTETAPEVVETFSATAPVAAPPGVLAPILSAVGIGDFLFLALFLAVTLRYSMRPAATLWATFVVMLFAPAAFIIHPTALGMPGLPFISAAVLWANWRYLEFTAEEKRAMLVAGALVLAAAVALWVVFH